MHEFRPLLRKIRHKIDSFNKESTSHETAPDPSLISVDGSVTLSSHQRGRHITTFELRRSRSDRYFKHLNSDLRKWIRYQLSDQLGMNGVLEIGGDRELGMQTPQTPIRRCNVLIMSYPLVCLFYYDKRSFISTSALSYCPLKRDFITNESPVASDNKSQGQQSKGIKIWFTGVCVTASLIHPLSGLF
jgi:hypothetical protein